MDQALVTIRLGNEATLVATAECRKALVSQHRADEIMDGVLGQGGGQGLSRLGVQDSSVIFNELVGNAKDSPYVAGESPLGSGLPQFSSHGAVAHAVPGFLCEYGKPLFRRWSMVWVHQGDHNQGRRQLR